MAVYNIGNVSRALLLDGKTTAEVLAAIKVAFPKAKTTAACVAWYKSDLRKKGMIAGGKASAKAATYEELVAMLAAMQPKVVVGEVLGDATVSDLVDDTSELELQ